MFTFIRTRRCAFTDCNIYQNAASGVSAHQHWKRSTDIDATNACRRCISQGGGISLLPGALLSSCARCALYSRQLLCLQQQCEPRVQHVRGWRVVVMLLLAHGWR